MGTSPPHTHFMNGLFLETLDHGVRVLMMANIKENRLEAIVRGAEMAVAKEIMSLIATEIEAVSKNYSGVTMKFEDTVVNGGTPKKWWELTPTADWEKRDAKGSGPTSILDGTSGIQLFSFYSNGVSEDNELVGKLKVALWSCGGSLDDVEEVFALYNSHSQQSFESHRILVATRHITVPSLFKKDHWKQLDKAGMRAEMVSEHEKHLTKFEWNSTEQLKVSLMVQGTTTEAAWSIAQGGFGVVAKEGDQGWYGRGIYTTKCLLCRAKLEVETLCLCLSFI